MEAAYLADNESNQKGKPAINKIRVLDKVLLKLKTPQFATYFLNKGGLEQFNNFLKRLPDGSWPLSQMREEILNCILELPCNEHHLKYTKLGKTLSTLQKSTHEYEENKKIIQEIKDKWFRIVSGVNMEYYNLESYEKENVELMRKKKKRSTSQNFVTNPGGPYATADGQPNIKMGYNFSIRPYSNLTKREPIRHEGATAEEFDKYLSKVRKTTKRQ